MTASGRVSAGSRGLRVPVRVGPPVRVAPGNLPRFTAVVSRVTRLTINNPAMYHSRMSVPPHYANVEDIISLASAMADASNAVDVRQLAVAIRHAEKFPMAHRKDLSARERETPAHVFLNLDIGIAEGKAGLAKPMDMKWLYEEDE